MAKKRKGIQVTIEDVNFIFDNNINDVEYLLSHCYCRNCNKGYNSVIINYSILLNSLNDIELDGFCSECHTSLKRYIETGDNAATAENAAAVWETHSTLKELKIKTSS